ncbi:hypothetical protein T07_9561 [Trichinella nelsoni]|uniref:Uncharacterized protein n=1 Tax=Trichinella nelsoni TaxID=6336 RepID=A0A0V0S885_9BILA|nr:hypothetical protein T07_9561 [Trichinella nelsoni]
MYSLESNDSFSTPSALSTNKESVGNDAFSAPKSDSEHFILRANGSRRIKQVFIRRPTTNNCCASLDNEDEEEEQSYRKPTGT